MRVIVLFISGAIALIAPATDAHHSGAMYDPARVITVEGVVSGYEWANPHVYIYLEETAESGEKIVWDIEGFPPSVMRRIGWTRDSVSIGDALTVTGTAARNPGNTSMFPTLIQRAGVTLYEQMDGTRRLASPGVEPQTPARGLDGTWETILAVPLLMSLAEPAIPLTDNGAAAVANFDNETTNPGANCIPHAAPLLMIDPTVKRMRIEADAIVIDAGYGGTVQRTIHMNRATHDGAPVSLQGHSIGRWDGDTLVIDTTRFADHEMGNAYAGVPSGPQKHLVEWLTVADDGKRLTYRFELSDPEFLDAPVTGEVEWAYRPDWEFVQQACDLQNARRFIDR